MKKITLILLIIIVTKQLIAQPLIEFDKYFEKKILRFDFVLAGDSKYQTAFLDGFRQEPIWGGPLKNLIDKFNYGEYAVEAHDKESGNIIFSTRFSTLFQEWRTTDEAKVTSRAFQNSVIMPFPKNQIIIKLLARDYETADFKNIFQTELDPKSIFIDKSELAFNTVKKIQYKGDPSQKVDLVFLAEGYSKAEQDKFFKDVHRLSNDLFEEQPFKSRRNDFNIWAVGLISHDSETDFSGNNIWKNTALNSGYWTFGLERYLTTSDYKAVRNAAWNVPCDAIIIVVNTKTYGGGGIYNFYSMVASDNETSAKVLVHEFGHGFGGLADEYFGKEVTYNDFYNLKTEPWEPNITTLVNFKQKWEDVLPPNTAIPTTVDKNNPYKLGVYEGGGYLSKGIYRPVDRCMMRDYSPFCPVCQQSINKIIDFFIDK